MLAQIGDEVVFSSRRRHTRFSGVTGVQTCALPICGHSPADIVFQKDNSFFGGDLILKGIYFNILLDIDPVTQKMCLLNQEYNRNIDTILNTFKIQQWYPGHGDQMNFSSLIKVNQKYQKFSQLIHQRIAQSFSFADYDSTVHKIYRYFPCLNDYFYLSDILTVIK